MLVRFSLCYCWLIYTKHEFNVSCCELFGLPRRRCLSCRMLNTCIPVLLNSSLPCGPSVQQRRSVCTPPLSPSPAGRPAAGALVQAERGVQQDELAASIRPRQGRRRLQVHLYEVNACTRTSSPARVHWKTHPLHILDRCCIYAFAEKTVCLVYLTR